MSQREKARLLLGAAAILFLQSCDLFDSDDFRSPTDPDLGFLTLTAQGDVTEIDADGASTLLIIATISSTQERDITFKTTRGTFVGAPTASLSQKTVKTSQGRATAELRSDTTPGIAVVTAEVTGESSQVLSVSLEIAFTRPDFDDVLRLESDKASLEANGIDTATLTATVGQNIADRSVEFETTLGELIGGSVQGSVRTVVADAAGKAEIRLRSGTRPAFAQVTARVSLDADTPIERRQTIEFRPIEDLDDILRFSQAPQVAPADGDTASVFVVTLNKALAPVDVTFKTTGGSFAQETSTKTDTTVPVGAGDTEARVILYSASSPGLAEITATVDDFARSTLLEFVRALPERIVVRAIPSTVEDKATEFVRIEADFLRNVGTVTVDTIPTFEVTDSSGVSFGVFRNITASDSRGKVSAEFSPGGSGNIGTATVTVGAEGTSVVGTTSLQVVSPTP